VKQTIVMILLTMCGTLGAFVSPFWGVSVYYLFAVLRPQYIWQWALPSNVRWSLFVALATLVATIFHSGSHEPPPGSGTGVTAPPKRYGSAHIAMFVFGLWVSVTFVTAQNREVAYFWYVEYLKIFLMFFVSALFLRTIREVWILMIIAAGALGYIAYEVNFLYLSVGYLGIYHNGYGGLDNNGAGLMLAMAVPLCLFIYMGTRRWWRWIFASLIPVLLHAVLMTYSRGAMVALLAASPAVFMRGKNRLQLLLAAFAIAAVVPVLAGKEIRHRFFSVEAYQEDGSAQSRFDSWNAAFRIAKDYPIFGVGVRNSNLYSFQYGADEEGRAIHSQFLQILADNGFPGLFLYLVMLGHTALGLRRVRKWASPRVDDPEAMLAYSVACGLESSLAVFCVGSLFLSLEVFELPYVMLLLAAQLPIVLQRQMSGAAASTPAPRPAPSFRPPTARWAPVPGSPAGSSQPKAWKT
jgi:probable O-glycosylation ligase (exosortase A-associated)